MNEENELELKLFLQSQIPDEIVIRDYWVGTPREGSNLIFFKTSNGEKVTDREWLEIARRVEEKLTHAQCYTYNSALINEKPLRPEVDHESEKWTWHAPWQTRAKALRKVLG